DANAQRRKWLIRGVDRRDLADLTEDAKNHGINVLADNQRICHQQDGCGIDDDEVISVTQGEKEFVETVLTEQIDRCRVAPTRGDQEKGIDRGLPYGLVQGGFFTQEL